jgi:hypothetical protein
MGGGGFILSWIRWQDLRSFCVIAIHRSLQDYFTLSFKRLFKEVRLSSSPLVVPNILEEPRLPGDFKQLNWRGRNACILAPLQAHHQSLGLVGIINDSVLDYSIEDINLFINITDQLQCRRTGESGCSGVCGRQVKSGSAMRNPMTRHPAHLQRSYCWRRSASAGAGNLDLPRCIWCGSMKVPNRRLKRLLGGRRALGLPARI